MSKLAWLLWVGIIIGAVFLVYMIGAVLKDDVKWTGAYPMVGYDAGTNGVRRAIITDREVGYDEDGRVYWREREKK